MGGIWYCDCDTRLPAEKFQVKNGGKNHGRWFYTCQQPQPKRCSFFLWSDDAKVREEAAVLSNIGTEPDGALAKIGPGGKLRSEQEPPKTPKRQTKITEPITPLSKSKSPNNESFEPPTEFDQFGESFDWSSSADDDLAEFADNLDKATSQLAADESPRKAVKLSSLDSPSKRADLVLPKTTSPAATSSGALPLVDDVFRTSHASKGSREIGLLSPGESPTPLRRTLFRSSDNPKQVASEGHPSKEPGSLAQEALLTLAPIAKSLPADTERALVDLLNNHELRSFGIERGRDIARAALHAKEKRIAELQQKLSALETERETSRTVIQYLKTGIATSPKKPRRLWQNFTHGED